MTDHERAEFSAELRAPKGALDHSGDSADALGQSTGGFYGRAGRKFLRDPIALVSLAILGIIVTVTLFAPIIATEVLHTTPEGIMRTPDGRIAILRPPGPGYPLGTDDLGRDALTRLLYAGRVSLTIGFLVAIIAITLGSAAGLVAGFFGGWVDDLINAIIQFLFNIPSLFILIILSITFQPGVLFLSAIFGLLSWPSAARQVRGVVLSVRGLDYVEAARVLGAGNVRVMVRHILPNVANIVLVVAGFDVAGAIIGESALSYLGFGVQVPLSSWGNMLSGSQDLFQRAPWLVYPPGIMIFITVLCVVLVTDGIRDAFDPRT